MKNLLKGVDEGVELRIMRHSFEGVDQPVSEAWSGQVQVPEFSC